MDIDRKLFAEVDQPCRDLMPDTRTSRSSTNSIVSDLPCFPAASATSPWSKVPYPDCASTKMAAAELFPVQSDTTKSPRCDDFKPTIHDSFPYRFPAVMAAIGNSSVDTPSAPPSDRKSPFVAGSNITAAQFANITENFLSQYSSADCEYYIHRSQSTNVLPLQS